MKRLLTFLLVGLLSLSVQAETIKTINGTATASVKTYNGTAVASLKTIDGLTYPAAGSTTFKVKHGTYVGTGSALSVTGVGFQPKYLIIKANANGASDDPVVAWDGFLGDSTHAYTSDPGATPATDLVTAYGSDGFTLGTNAIVNTLSTTYYYVAITGSSSEVVVGSYAGDASSPRAISSIGLAPDFVQVRRGTSTTARWKFSSQSTNNSFNGSISGSTAEDTSEGIISLDATGFTVGTDVNASSNTYYYVAVDIPTGYGEIGSYAGNTDDNRTISFADSGLLPNIIFIKGSSTSNAIMKGDANVSGDHTTTLINNGSGDSVNMIQAISTGSMQVGTHSSANNNTFTMHYMALKTSP